MRTFKYDMITAIIDYGVNMHPFTQMHYLGFKVEDYYQEPELGCWWFNVSNNVGGLPEYVTEVAVQPVDSGCLVEKNQVLAVLSDCLDEARREHMSGAEALLLAKGSTIWLGNDSMKEAS